MTTYKSILAIFISPTNPKAVAIIGITFSGILIDLMFPFYYNWGSDCSVPNNQIRLSQSDYLQSAIRANSIAIGLPRPQS